MRILILLGLMMMLTGCNTLQETSVYITPEESLRLGDTVTTTTVKETKTVTENKMPSDNGVTNIKSDNTGGFYINSFNGK